MLILENADYSCALLEQTTLSTTTPIRRIANYIQNDLKHSCADRYGPARTRFELYLCVEIELSRIPNDLFDQKHGFYRLVESIGEKVESFFLLILNGAKFTAEIEIGLPL